MTVKSNTSLQRRYDPMCKASVKNSWQSAALAERCYLGTLNSKAKRGRRNELMLHFV